VIRPVISSPAAIGRRVEVLADLSRVQVRCEDRVVADHERVWAKHQSISDPEHVAAARQLCRERLTVVRTAQEPEVGQRCPADYDTALGVEVDGAGSMMAATANRAGRLLPRRHGCDATAAAGAWAARDTTVSFLGS
jgi:Mu transposase-like protein